MATIETNPSWAPDQGGREGVRPPLLVGAERDRPDSRSPGAEGRHFWDYDGKRYLDFAVAARQRLDRLRAPEG
jgi:hypothetical protein